MAFLDRHVLRNLEVVHSLEDRESLTDRANANVLERLMVEMNEDVARDAVLCSGTRVSRTCDCASACPTRAHL